MLIGLLRQLAKLPLSWIHAVGGALGWMVYLLSGTYASRLRENLRQSGLCPTEAAFRRILHRNISESGKAGAELVPVWFKPVAPVVRMIVRAGPMSLVEEAEQRGRGLIYLTPHLGCFDAAALWAAQRRPITVLYRPPRKPILQPIIDAGRGRDRVQLAPANLGGVRLLLKALRRGDAVGILPDQVPANGEGVWADFFGRPAYTMTLVGKLVAATGATILMAAAVRLPRGGGYEIHFEKFEGDPSGPNGARALNAAIERMVAIEPAQYLWSYNRYKVPSGVAPPGANAAATGGETR
ncbi:MAG TPA: lysophospholipid acyltransferase family protein [Burkholderiales bacterium]|nr:lysophospholipid acyltransferase family protein [Burkholderiales bacterium]